MGEQELRDTDFLKIFIKTKNFFKSSFILLLIFTFSGGLLSTLNYYYIDNYYATDFVVTDGSMVEGKVIKDIIDHSRNGYITNINLNSTPAEINAIQLDFRNVKNLHVDTSIKNGLMLKLKIYDNEKNLNSLKKSIISLLSNNTYLSEIASSKKEYLITELKSVQESFLFLETMQKNLLSNTNSTPFNSTDFAKNLVNLRNHQSNLSRELNTLGKYKVIRDIYKPNSPQRTIKSSLLFGLILGLFLGIILSILYQLNKLSKEKI